ncbi:MAG: cysteine hydrolase [Rhizobiales bacterium]|nr:cysteine hydrolase [Hyphomicrobiales bacterium]
MPPRTLLDMAGAMPVPPPISESVLVIIDAQNEYLEGPLALTGVAPAIAQCASVLAAYRAAGAPVIHIAHKGRPGGAFDRDAPRGQIVDALAPVAGETVIEKPLPNSFAKTALTEAVAATDRTKLVMIGFMTHMCVSSTARAALDLGFSTTILADACATRDLPDGDGGVVSAETLHRAELAALSDRFAGIFSCATFLSAQI